MNNCKITVTVSVTDRDTGKALARLGEEVYQVIYGFSFYDGAKSGLVRDKNNTRYFFEWQGEAAGDDYYVIYQMNETALAEADRFIKHYEFHNGTSLRYISGRRIKQDHPEYSYHVKNWPQFCMMPESRFRHEFSSEDILGYTTDLHASDEELAASG